MHLKRYVIPSYWKVAKKGNKFAVRPRAGPHPIGSCIPLTVIIRNVMGMAQNAGEAGRIIKSGGVLVDKKERKDPNFPVGLMDVLEFPAMKKSFRVTVDRKGLALQEIKSSDSGQKLCRIKNKKLVNGGKIQLSLHDGRNILVGKSSYKTSDSLLIKLPEQKIMKHFKFEKGAKVMIVSGRNLGLKGKIKEIQEKKHMLEVNRTIIETNEGDIETVKDYILVGEFK